MAIRHVPESRDPTATGRLDYPGAVLAGLGLGGTTYALIQAPERGSAAVTSAIAGDRECSRSSRSSWSSAAAPTR